MSLTVDYNEIKRRVGRYLGFAADPDLWSDDERTDVDDVIKTGMQMFYQPPLIENKQHQWSFLEPTYDLTTVADDWEYDLPAGYSSLSGPIHFEASDNAWTEIQITSPAEIRRLRQTTGNTDLAYSYRPEFAAVEPKPGTGNENTYQILFWPTPDAIYTMKVRYRLSPQNLSESNLTPIGGEPHARTILLACLASAELHMNDERGVRHQAFMESLAASVRFDQDAHTADYLGKNKDNSDGEDDIPRYRTRQVLYNGVSVS